MENVILEDICTYCGCVGAADHGEGPLMWVYAHVYVLATGSAEQGKVSGDEGSLCPADFGNVIVFREGLEVLIKLLRTAGDK